MSDARPDDLTGKRIVLLRLAQGLSQREVAKGLHKVSYAYISRIESGERQPTWRALAEIAERLGTTALYLASGDGNGACPMCGRGTNQSH